MMVVAFGGGRFRCPLFSQRAPATIAGGLTFTNGRFLRLICSTVPGRNRFASLLSVWKRHREILTCEHAARLDENTRIRMEKGVA